MLTTQSEVNELKTTKQQIGGQTFPNALGKATLQTKHLGKKTHTQLPHTSAEMQQSIQGTALSHISSFLQKSPLHSAQLNQTHLRRQLP